MRAFTGTGQDLPIRHQLDKPKHGDPKTRRHEDTKTRRHEKQIITFENHTFLYSILQRIRFLLQATNQHGVHSPFVYAYITKCIYAKPDYHEEKSLNILLKSLAYFQIRRIGLPSKPSAMAEITAEKIKCIRPNILVNQPPYDAMLTSCSEGLTLLETASEEYHIHKNSMIFVEDMYQSPESRAAWEKLKEHPKVRVSIDFFYCAVVFFRKEQAREHFKIRL